VPRWIYLCCREPLDPLPASQLARGITAGDPERPAGIDYLTLAEDYPIGKRKNHGELITQAVGALEVAEAPSDGHRAYKVRYAPWPARPIVVHRWDDEKERNEIVESLFYKGAPIDRGAVSIRDVVEIQLWRHQLDDAGIVIAYEIARYLGQIGGALILDDRGHWKEVQRGGWRDLGTSARSRPSPYLRATEETFLSAAQSRADPVAWLLGEGRRLFLDFRVVGEEAAAWLAAVHAASASADAPAALVDAVADEALDNGGINVFTAPVSVMKLVHQFVAALPQQRAEALVAPPTGVRWRFTVDQPTPYVIERAVAEVTGWARITNMFARHFAIGALPRLGADAAGPIIRALEGRPPQRIVLLASLAAMGVPAARDTLTRHLRDRIERVRLVAKWGLTILDRPSERKPAAGATDRWCAGCGLVVDDAWPSCPMCATRPVPLPESPWRALRIHSCPCDLNQA
jgi:hypothetical protein